MHARAYLIKGSESSDSVELGFPVISRHPYFSKYSGILRRVVWVGSNIDCLKLIRLRNMAFGEWLPLRLDCSHFFSHFTVGESLMNTLLSYDPLSLICNKLPIKQTALTLTFHKSCICTPHAYNDPVSQQYKLTLSISQWQPLFSQLQLAYPLILMYSSNQLLHSFLNFLVHENYFQLLLFAP